VVKTQALRTPKSRERGCWGFGWAGFVPTDVMCIFEAFQMLECYNLRQRRQRGYNSTVLWPLVAGIWFGYRCQTCSFSRYDQIWAYLFTLLLCENDTRLDLMLECAGQEPMNTAQKVFQWPIFLCFELLFHDSWTLCRSSYDFKAWAQVPSCVRKCVFVLCAKPAIYNHLQTRYMQNKS
jgi:hypothetical protein